MGFPLFPIIVGIAMQGPEEKVLNIIDLNYLFIIVTLMKLF